MLKQITLITQHFISLQSRPEADMVDILKFENQREPPSLSDCGLLGSGNKLDILVCIKAPTACVCTTRQVLLIRLLSFIWCAQPQYVSLNGFPFLENQPTSTGAHNYPEKFKSLTQKRRGTGVRTRLEPNSDGITPIPKRDWQSYLKNEDSKRELFSCISKRLAGDGADKQIVKY